MEQSRGTYVLKESIRPSSLSAKQCGFVCGWAALYEERDRKIIMYVY